MSANRVDPTVSRRRFFGTAAAVAGACAGAELLVSSRAHAAGGASLAASPPAGFVPMAAPGKIIKVSKSDVLMPNGLFPKEDAARMMLERAMTEFTGETDLAKAFARFVHKDDKVAIKMNGIAGQTGGTMATNKELILPIVAGVIAAGVPAANIVVYEQYTSFFNGTRVSPKNLPAGVVTMVHGNKDATMSEIRVLGITTKFVRPLTEATAVINVALIKDHSKGLPTLAKAGRDPSYIRVAAELGLGVTDMGQIRLREVTL